MRKSMCMVAGIVVGSACVCLFSNSKKTLNTLVNYGDSLLNQLNNKLEEFALMVENLDEEKMKRKMKAKYNNIKEKVKSIDFKKMTDDAKAAAENLLQELNSLIMNKGMKES